MRQFQILIMSTVLMCVLFACARSGEAAVSLKVTNNTQRPMELWIWPYRLGRWKRPPSRFAPKESKHVHFNKGEDYFLLFRDDLRRETPVGRHNISKVLAANPKYELAISQVVACTVREVYFWCRRCRRWHRVVRAEPTYGRYVAEWLDRRARTAPLRVPAPET